MKNKFSFLMPRLIGATVVAGLAALVITTLFKLLLGITLLAGAIMLAAKSFGNRRKLAAQYGRDSMPGAGNWNTFENNRNPIQPVNSYSKQKGTSIIPIN